MWVKQIFSNLVKIFPELRPYYTQRSRGARSKSTTHYDRSDFIAQKVLWVRHIYKHKANGELQITASAFADNILFWTGSRVTVQQWM